MAEVKKTENFWLNLGFNIVIPSLLLIKGKKIWSYFGDVPEGADVWIFIFALAFPIIYGVYDLASRKKWNFISIIGVLSVVLTGGIGLMELSREWIIVKEGAVPLLIGLAVLITAPTKKPLVKVLMMNDSILNVKKIDEALDSQNKREDFEKSMRIVTYIVAASFVLSSILNFLLAAYIFKSPTGTEAFNEEVGRMTMLSFPVIVLPTMVVFIFAMMKLFSSITSLTGMNLEELMVEKSKK